MLDHLGRYLMALFILRYDTNPVHENEDTGTPGPVFCLLPGVSTGCARSITGQVTSVTWPVIG